MKLKFIFLLFLSFSPQINFAQSEKTAIEYLNKANRLNLIITDSAFVNYKKALVLSTKDSDTIVMIRSIIGLSNIYGHQGNYSKAYDGFWEALLLSEAIKSEMYSARIYQGIGFLYSFFKRDEEALKYFKRSLHISKTLHHNNKIPISHILSDYFSILNHYRVAENYEYAQKYLDSCLTIQSYMGAGSRNFYLETEAGYLLAEKKQFKSALNKLNASKKFFEEKESPYLVIVNYNLGHTYKLMNDLKKSEERFLESLKISQTQQSHSNYKIMNCDALADLYYSDQQYKKAFQYLSLSKKYNEEIFGSNNENNKELLNIKDNYRLTKERQNKDARETLLKHLEHEEKIGFLKQVLLLVSLVFILLFGYLFIRNLRLKHRTEKKIIRERQQIEIQRQRDILELKNKELTTSALQLIEKEEFLNNLNDKLSKQKDTIDVRTIKRMVKTIQGNSSGNWKEFEARFTSINQSFYKNLKERFPELGQTDQKICSLIKLKFSSKEMASLLGISVESVHTSRYRLRKKLGLERNDNLTEFINSL
ncbi:tetratricopeptide repeat protein [Flavicella sediminum]|uniref:tetratricopeptide repeat protein n=1 Tax=Flavicella sediminum TaxID=2585141 RepID=UPI0011221D07|nr:tetratricopeptide repeat protein [Flavicella sediminum]